MDEQKEVLNNVRKFKKLSMTKLATFSGIGYYKLKLQIIPSLIKDKKVKLVSNKSYTYVVPNNYFEEE